MLGLKLFDVNSGVTEVAPRLAEDEKDVQNLIEAHMETMLGLGHHGTGNLEVRLRTHRDLERAQELFRLSYVAA